MMIAVGPGRYMDAAEARRKGLQEYVPPAGQSMWGTRAYAERHAAPARSQTGQQRATGPAPVKSPAAPSRPAYKHLPPFPGDEVPCLHTWQMTRQELDEEFRTLSAWLEKADGAPGRYSVVDGIFRDQVAERIGNVGRRLYG